HLILHLHQNHLIDYDLSSLTIRQGYFQDSELHRVNLSHSHLIDCVFAETFGRIASLAVSPDGQMVAAGTTDGKVHLWRLADYKRIETLEAHGGWVWSVAFSPDSRLLATGGSDQK